MWIAREYEPTLRNLSKQFPVVVVTGPRQVGKTALVKRVFPEATYVTLDLPSVAAQAEKNSEGFIRGLEEPAIIDEMQYAPSLFRYLKAIIDEDRRPGRFILTGSQNFLLMQGISESLAGRCAVLNMLNLSAAEVKGIDGYKEDEYLFKGGYPELYAREGIDPAFWYSSYLGTYLERDVRNILSVGNLRDFDRFLRAVAIRTGQILSYSDLARDIGLSVNTAKKWISVLEASGQIYLLEPYYRNIAKRLIKSPKLYMSDTGLAAFLMGFENWQAVTRNPHVGALWETHVVMQVVKHYYALGKSAPLWFWRTIPGDEVDLLIEQGGRFVAVECKYAENVSERDLKGLRALKKEYGETSLIAGYVASRSGRSYPLSKSIEAVPGSSISEYLP
ncbi:MAG: ATP-binding protein [Syntrophorhabdaceae bacterium]|nr:ATP-binding protein [Syntrophorhabdaceae bacterium]